MMEWNRIVPGLKEAAALAVNNWNWRPVRTLLEDTIPKDSVEYRQLQQIDVNYDIIEKACTQGFTELLSVFLNSGLPVNKSNETMLYIAACYGHISMVKLLLNVGADIDCKTRYGKTPLYYAAKYHRLDMVKHLISAGADINTCDEHGENLLDAACFYSTVTEEMLQLLLDSGCDPSKCHSRSPLYSAVNSNNIKCVKMLLEAGAHVNGMVRNRPLHSAACHANIPIMELLLEYGADINARGPDGNTALHVAVKSNKLQSVEFLIKHGSLINSINYFQETPLTTLYFHNEQLDVTLLLINSGADVNLAFPETLLHRAIYRGAPIHVIECLLEHGADVTAVRYNETALQQVISYSDYSNDWNIHVAKLLLIYGSNHYEKDRYGNTLLHWACRIGDMDLVEYLIDYGLDVDSKNIEGKKPYDISRERGYNNVAKAIIHHLCNKYTSF